MSSCLHRAQSALIIIATLLGQSSLSSIVSVDAAQNQIPIGLSVLGGHDHVNDGIHAGGQVDEQVAQNIHYMVVDQRTVDLGHGNWQVAHEKGDEDDEDHFEESPVLRCHFPRINGRR